MVIIVGRGLLLQDLCSCLPTELLYNYIMMPSICLVTDETGALIIRDTARAIGLSVSKYKRREGKERERREGGRGRMCTCARSEERRVNNYGSQSGNC